VHSRAERFSPRVFKRLGSKLLFAVEVSIHPPFSKPVAFISSDMEKPEKPR
jgi:hypothetical protein